MKFIKERTQGKSFSEAAIAAGYSEKNARQSGYQAMQQLRGRVPDLMDKHGLRAPADWCSPGRSEDTLIDKYLRPLLEAEETKFFAIRGKLESRKVKVNGVRHAALNTAFMLHGSYAPRRSKGNSAVRRELHGLASNPR
jgi:hypothetical protein